MDSLKALTDSRSIDSFDGNVETSNALFTTELRQIIQSQRGASVPAIATACLEARGSPLKWPVCHANAP